MTILLAALTLLTMGVQGAQQFVLEHAEASPKNAQIAGVADQIFYATQGLTGAELVIGHVGNMDKPRWNPFQGRPERHRIRDIAVDGSGELFMAYSQQSREKGWIETRFAKTKYGSMVSDIWATDELWVESFSISNQGFFYLLGVPQEIYLSLGRPGVTSGRRVTNLVHIFDDQFQRVASLIPTEITPGNIRVVLQILRESTITIRANGNFFVTLSPMTSQLINADLVTTSQQIIEYDPLGNIFEVHSVPAEAPTTPVSAVVPDGDGGLVVQFARVEAKEPSFPHPGGPIVGQTAFIIRAPTIALISSDRATMKLYQLERGERLVAVEQGGNAWSTVKIAGGPTAIRHYRRERVP